MNNFNRKLNKLICDNKKNSQNLNFTKGVKNLYTVNYKTFFFLRTKQDTHYR